ncbi:RNA polymerase sigma factor [Ekhidna sp.]|uniref:RNA polymerase sigma factor n=1 Tax=Ekhidna sp. TaxID=2608089 RepID=UPI0032991A80
MNPFQQEYQTDEDDKELIEKALKGSKAALEKLLKKHQPFIFNIAWKMVQNPNDAQDITQEVLIKVTTKLAQFRGQAEFRTWLYRIVANHFLKMRKIGREEVVTDFQTFGNILDSFENIELTELEQEEKENEIREMNLACMSGMLLCLTRDQRMVYILGELFNADHTIGSEILGISKQNFRVRLSRARKDLFQFMNHKCGLVNKSNPCRCYKKVTVMIENKRLDSRNLLFNREEYSNFQKHISKDADEALSIVEDQYRQLHDRLPFKKDFDRKTFLDEVISDEKVVRLFNLN